MDNLGTNRMYQFNYFLEYEFESKFKYKNFQIINLLTVSIIVTLFL